MCMKDHYCENDKETDSTYDFVYLFDAELGADFITT